MTPHKDLVEDKNNGDYARSKAALVTCAQYKKDLKLLKALGLTHKKAGLILVTQWEIGFIAGRAAR